MKKLHIYLLLMASTGLSITIEAQHLFGKQDSVLRTKTGKENEPRKVPFFESAMFSGNVSIGMDHVVNNALLVRSGSGSLDEFEINPTVQIQRFAHPGDNRYTNPKALRVLNTVYDGVSATEWAMSAELESYTNLYSEGNTANSGVAWKHARGQVFAGHFQANDETGKPSADKNFGGSIVGVEINLSATGDDNVITAEGYPGIRIGLDMPAHSKAEGAMMGRYGAGIRVRNSAGAWKKGVHVFDHYGTEKAAIMDTGLEITTRGKQSILINGDPHTALEIATQGSEFGISIDGTQHSAGIRIDGPKAYALMVTEKPSKAAIMIPEKAFISLESTNTIKFRYEDGRIQFYNGDKKIGYIDTSVEENRRLN